MINPNNFLAAAKNELKNKYNASIPNAYQQNQIQQEPLNQNYDTYYDEYVVQNNATHHAELMSALQQIIELLNKNNEEIVNVKNSIQDLLSRIEE